MTKKKTKKPAAEKRPAKMRQTRIPGTEAPVEPEVHAAGLAYVKKRDARIGASAEEKSTKIALINTMKRLGVKVYKDMEADPPVVITLNSKDDVKVTEINDDDPELAEQGDDAGDVEQLEPDREDAGGDENEPPQAA